MIFTETVLPGAFIVDVNPLEDDRGLFARIYCADEFASHGLNVNVAQGNLSFNRLAGTVRGMHYQLPPATETKLVRCTRGAVLDVIVDLRPGPTYLRHVAVELSEHNRRALYVPEMFAHGYQTLTDRAEVTYQVSAPYTPGAERGLRHDDPLLGIRWPLAVQAISAKDASWPLLSPGAAPDRSPRKEEVAG